MQDNPYPGTSPIKSSSRLFGRQKDVAVVRSHLVSRRWTVVHGRSGCGKTSLLSAGINDAMKKHERHRVRILDTWSGDQTLESRICEKLRWHHDLRLEKRFMTTSRKVGSCY